MIRKLIRVFISFFIIFSLLYGLIYIKGNDEGAFAVEEKKPSEVDSDYINFVLMGIDTKDSKEDIKVRTDTLMVFNINKSNGKISLLSVPRDTRVSIEGRKYKEKVNHAHVYGGPELSLDTISNLLDLRLEYYVVADYNFVKEFVDLIGGVNINVPMDMNYEDPSADPPLYIDLKEGEQLLDGDKSIQFLRFRSGYKDADLGRINAQQQFIRSITASILKPINILKTPMFINAYNEYINTNIPIETILKFAVNFAKYDLKDMNIKTLPGEAKMMNGVSYYINSKEETKSLVKDMFSIQNEYVNSSNIAQVAN